VNRRQLFNDMWKMLIGKPALWIVALIGSGVGVAINLVLSSLSFDVNVTVALGLLGTFVTLVTTAFVTGALVWMVNAVVEGQSISVNEGFQAGTRKLVPLVFVQLALMLPIWIIVLLFTGSFAAVFTSAFGRSNGVSPSTVLPLLMAGSFVGLAIAAIIVSIVTSLISVGADRSVVLEDLTVFAALKRGWQLARQNFSDFVGIGVYMLIVGLGIAILFSCTVGAMISATLVGQAAAFGEFGTPTSFSAPVIITTLVNLALNTFLATLFSGVWTLAYREWTATDEPIEQLATIERK